MNVQSINNSIGELLEGPLVFSPCLFNDERGNFFESWNSQIFDDLLLNHDQGPQIFLQDNQSFSRKGVLRGLHYQITPHVQGKLVRCIAGEIYDVIVDLRMSSKTFKSWGSINLSAQNKKQLWVPVGFAHGFLSLTDCTEVLYKTTDYWDPKCERGISWDDPDIKIIWPENFLHPELSKKDLMLPSFSELKSMDMFE
ncbi:dTDP-4-dehydrorhamnose 3,5-epimerase [Prochlorococcus marinus str. NATL2A]|uniref:dTDP-4-dehydrorhamnose 3,5-epimerase n=1 Tax=Prochlorococcus marinus (strain NATL2A) TaxID=59920 RepID=Q46IE8_PROMT|nr:dTDP-4-dehydrorhamnose 3,5-epimerase [Prochlorococcus marinus]AAZ58730.1 dTDP-4-dehydrorhamnose 3,5-epimerase [Prochlorococcus marinus str. NATL2A]